MDVTAASSASRPRATIATSAPEAAKRVAIARPMPLLPPVTMAERPLSEMSMYFDPAGGITDRRSDAHAAIGVCVALSLGWQCRERYNPQTAHGLGGDHAAHRTLRIGGVHPLQHSAGTGDREHADP